MIDLPTLIQQGSTNLWLFIPAAIALGALHGLEPGHSKTMMAAFIVAVRGTVGQAVLLGLSATISHTLIVWAVALGGLYLGQHWDAGTSEPYFQLASAAIMVLLAVWMLQRTWKYQQIGKDHHHSHAHDHGHHHHHEHHSHCDHDHEAEEEDHTTPLPHYHPPASDNATSGSQDPHQRAHALAIEKRFQSGTVTTPQLILFGLTGGLIPCPASITVLLVCLQLKKLALGTLLVACFSVGLALTMVSTGVVAALSLRHLSKRWPGFATLAARAPYFSGVLIIAIALAIGASALRAL